MTTEVHDHFLHVSPTRLNVQDVEKVAGPKIASFCKDYQTFNAVATPITHQKRGNINFLTSVMSFIYALIQTQMAYNRKQ